MSERKVYLLDKLEDPNVNEHDKAQHQAELNGILQSEQVIAVAHENRVGEATEKAAYLLDNIQIAGVPASESGIAEDVFNILRSKVQAAFVGQAEDFSGLIRGYEENEIQLQRQNKELQADYTGLQNAHVDYTKTVNDVVYQLEIDKRDAEEKRDAAVRAKEEAEELLVIAEEKIAKMLEENQRLELKVNEQRAELALGVSGSIRVVESTDEQIRRQEEALRASRIKVTSMVKKDPTGISDRLWIIVLALTGEEKEINYLEKGLYTVISEEEAIQLRAELEATKPIEPPSFDNVEFEKVEEPQNSFLEGTMAQAIQSEEPGSSENLDSAENQASADAGAVPEESETVNEEVTEPPSDDSFVLHGQLRAALSPILAKLKVLEDNQNIAQTFKIAKEDAA